MAKTSPFEYVKAIGERGDDPVASGELPIGDYNAFMVARALGHRLDASGAVHFVNTKPKLTSYQHYSILKMLVKPRRASRGEFWAKSGKDDDVIFVSTTMGIGMQAAKEIVWAVGRNGVDEMRRRSDPGGRRKR